jgi:hypothetical protein
MIGCRVTLNLIETDLFQNSTNSIKFLEGETNPKEKLKRKTIPGLLIFTGARDLKNLITVSFPSTIIRYLTTVL